MRVAAPAPRMALLRFSVEAQKELWGSTRGGSSSSSRQSPSGTLRQCQRGRQAGVGAI